MHVSGSSDESRTPPAGRTPETDWERKRRLARIFGDVLPDTTADERDPEAPTERSKDEWLKSQVPPHHGS